MSGAVRLPHRGWLFDLDGTVYRGEALVPGADATIAALRADGRRVAFLSNKPLETRADYARKLTRLGVPTDADDVVNSSLVLARHLAGLDPGAPVFVIGEPPLLAELRAHGFEVRADHRVRWVVIAFDRTFDYAKLNTALQAVRQGARLIATNPDRTCPTEDGEIPDCAGMTAAVEAVTGARVEAVVGKPSPIILEVALARLYTAARRFDEAERHALNAFEVIIANQPPASPAARKALQVVILVYEQSGRGNEAAKWRAMRDAELAARP